MSPPLRRTVPLVLPLCPEDLSDSMSKAPMIPPQNGVKRLTGFVLYGKSILRLSSFAFATNGDSPASALGDPTAPNRVPTQPFLKTPPNVCPCRYEERRLFTPSTKPLSLPRSLF